MKKERQTGSLDRERDKTDRGGEIHRKRGKCVLEKGEIRTVKRKEIGV